MTTRTAHRASWHIGVVALLLGATAAGGSNTLLKCTPLSAVSLGNNHGFLTASRAEAQLIHNETYVIDLDSGLVRKTIRQDGETHISSPVRYIVAQTGNDVTDTVLTRSQLDRNALTYSKADLVTASTHFIRVRHWKDMQRTLFIAYELSTVISGTCELVQ